MFKKTHGKVDSDDIQEVQEETEQFAIVMKNCGEPVKAHDGNAKDRNAEGELLLKPAVDEAHDSVEKSSRYNGHGELVMVVDDEVSVRNTIGQLLEIHGYKVITADNGAQAVAAVLANKPNLRAVLIDMMMPLMDGVDAMQAIHNIAYQIPIIVISGFLNDDLRSRFSRIKPRAVISKPFSKNQLLVPLHEILNNPKIRPFSGPAQST